MAIKVAHPKKASISLQDAIKAFLEAQKAKGAAPRTLLNYQSFLRLFAANLPTNMLIHRISPTDITKHLSRYERPASRNGHLRHLQAFFRWTVKRGWRDDDPTIPIERARIVDEPITILSVEQCARLLDGYAQAQDRGFPHPHPRPLVVASNPARRADFFRRTRAPRGRDRWHALSSHWYWRIYPLSCRWSRLFRPHQSSRRGSGASR